MNCLCFFCPSTWTKQLPVTLSAHFVHLKCRICTCVHVFLTLPAHRWPSWGTVDCPGWGARPGQSWRGMFWKPVESEHTPTPPPCTAFCYTHHTSASALQHHKSEHNATEEHVNKFLVTDVFFGTNIFKGCIHAYLGLSTDGEFVLVQQMCELRNIQLQKFIQFIDFSEVNLKKIICSHLQLWTVHAVCKGWNAYRRTEQE